jgi:hypothetical protein
VLVLAPCLALEPPLAQQKGLVYLVQMPLDMDR